MRVIAGVSIALAISWPAASAGRAQPLTPAITVPGTLNETSIVRAHATGAQAVRLGVEWSSVAPKKRPSDFDAADPSDPAYSWQAYDREISAAVVAGLQPIVYTVGARS